jgi:hypothetical protein
LAHCGRAAAGARQVIDKSLTSQHSEKIHGN